MPAQAFPEPPPLSLGSPAVFPDTRPPYAENHQTLPEAADNEQRMFWIYPSQHPYIVILIRPRRIPHRSPRNVSLITYAMRPGRAFARLPIWFRFFRSCF